MKPIITALLFLLILTPRSVEAEEISFSITPPLLIIKTSPLQVVEREFIIENNKDTPLTLTIEPRTFTTKKTTHGEVLYNSSKPEIFNNLSFSDENGLTETINLSPKQKKQLRLRLTVPEQTKEQDYYFSLLFTSEDNKVDQIQQPNESIAQTQLHASLAMHVLLSILNTTKPNKDNLPKGNIKTFKTPVLTDSTPVSFALNIENTDRHVFSPVGTVLIRNVFGQAVGRINIPQNHILAYTNREFDFMWRDSGNFGPYSAELTIALSDQGPLFKRTIWFIVVPFRVLFAFCVTIAILFLILSRLKRYRRCPSGYR